MNEKRINSRICRIPLRKSKIENILQSLRKIQQNVIHTTADFCEYEILFKVEFKLNALLKQSKEKVTLKYKLSTVRTISNLFDNLLIKIFKERENMSEYEALFKFNERLNKYYHITEDQALELEASLAH